MQNTNNSELDGQILNSDICIVGAGAAGITIAQQLIGSNLSVYLLESGGWQYDPDAQSLYQGSSVGREYFDLASTRLRYFGGATNHWGGMSAKLDDWDFEKRDWVSMSGWPLSHSDLLPYYKRAINVCDLNDSLQTIKSLTAATGLSALDFGDEKDFFSRAIQYSPPTRFGKKFKNRLLNAKNVKVFLNSTVLKFIANDNGTHIDRVEVSSLLKKRFFVRARKFIVATGGIENPRLLLLSDDLFKQGLGNKSGYVGRCFMEHPHRELGTIIPNDLETDFGIYVGKRWRRKKNIRSSAFVSPTKNLQYRDKLLNGVFWFHVEYKERSLLQRVLNRTAEKFYHRDFLDFPEYNWFTESGLLINKIAVTGSFEQEPNRESRVGLSNELDALDQRRVELDWHLTGLDVESVEKTMLLFGKILGERGLGRLKIDITETASDGSPGGHHHMGTTRMSNSDLDGVVDKDCRVHGLDNLYIAGSSVFSTAGTVNPTFTIVALGLRLADHLEQTT